MIISAAAQARGGNPVAEFAYVLRHADYKCLILLSWKGGRVV